MPRNKIKRPQSYTISPDAIIPQPSFNLDASDTLVKDLGVKLIHYKALPSPLQKSEVGNYRIGEELLQINNLPDDVILTANFLYKKSGCFIGVLLNNAATSTFTDMGGFITPAQVKLILPRFYENGERIYLAPGDRIYLYDKDADMTVENFELIQWNPAGIDVATYPIKKVEYLIDSQGIEYKEGVDFEIDSWGRIKWKTGGRNPGLDNVTGKGKVYSIRYKYIAFFYVLQLLNEIRITNITKNDTRIPERMPYHALLVREYVINKNPNIMFSQQTDDPRLIGQSPPNDLNTGVGFNNIKIKVNMDD